VNASMTAYLHVASCISIETSFKITPQTARFPNVVFVAWLVVNSLRRGPAELRDLLVGVLKVLPVLASSSSII
jgi:hypothetical protein